MTQTTYKRRWPWTGWLALSLALTLLSSPFIVQAQNDVPEGKTLVKPPQAADGATTRGPVVKEIEIEYAGPRSVDRSVILSNMRTAVGQPYSLPAVEEDIRNLYATGLFVNLRIYDEPLADGLKVVVIVQPKPTVKEIIVVGSDQISEKRIRKEMKSKAGEPLSEQKLSEDRQKIEDYYRLKGFYNAQIEYKTDVNEQSGRSVVTFTITEDKKRYVRYVTFEGNKNFEEDELRDLMETRKKNIFSFINKSGLLREEKFKEDQKKLKDFYQKNGYIDMQIRDISYSYPEDELVDIKITVFEGIQYHVGKVNFQGNQLFTASQIMGRMVMLDGDIFSPQGLDGDMKNIQDLYGERGYLAGGEAGETQVRVERQPNIQSGKMDLLYTIDEGDQAFVERIVIQGNNRTKDKVLRRELAVAPGDVYDTVRVDASKKRLENLGYFSKVDVSPKDTAVPNRKDMVVTVEEQRTGSVTFGVGFSTVDSLLGFVELSQGNFDYSNFPSFTGAGQKFRSRIQYGLTRKDLQISWTEPWFLDKQLSFGFDLFYNSSSYQSSIYDMERYGAAVRVGKALNQFWRVGLRYQAENIGVIGLDHEAPRAIKNEAGYRTKSSVRANLTYDSRDDLFLTRSGEKIEFAAEGAGGPIMGDTDIWKLEMEATKYFSLPFDLIYSAGVSGTVVGAYGDSEIPPLFDRTFAGGSRSIRGFNNRDIGPYADSEPFGGQTMIYTNHEITFPIIDRVRGAVFLDAGFNNGNVNRKAKLNLNPGDGPGQDHDTNDPGEKPERIDTGNRTFDLSLDDFAIGTGVGLRLNLPIGPLRLDLGVPLMEHSEFNPSTSVKFHFDVGYQF